MDNEFKFFDEFLDEVEYYEILSLNEVLKDNPDFKAFSREEIYDELFNFFQNSNTAYNLIDMFYKKPKIHQNYIFIIEAFKKKYDEDIESFIETLEKSSKLQYTQAQESKDKLFFALDYDNDSQKIKLKQQNKTSVEIHNNKEKLNYLLFNSDDVNVPVNAVYYRKPKTVIQDYIYSKILSKYEKHMLLNLVKTDTFDNVEKVLKLVKPTLDQILKYLPDDDIDYNTVNNLLLSFDSSYDEISQIDFQTLKQHYDHLLNTKIQNIKYKTVEPKSIKFSHNNISDSFKNIINLIPLQYDDIESLISQLEDEKINLNYPGLIFNNPNDIINAIKNKDISFEDVIQNIQDYKKISVIQNTVNFLLQMKNTNYEDIITNIEQQKVYKQPTHKDLYDLTFLNFQNELKEVKEANDFSNYDGIPPIYKNENLFEGMIDRENDIEVFVPPIVTNNAILLSQRYKHNVGFREMLEIVLKILDDVETNSMLILNKQVVSEELYKYFSAVATKKDLLLNILNQNNVVYPEDYIEKVIKLTPKTVLNTENEHITEYLKECNRQYIQIIFQMIYTALSWWTISILEDNMNGFLIFDQNKMMIQYIDKWSLTGLPLDKNANDGVIVYLSEIAQDILEESIYTSPKSILKSCLSLIQEKYTNELKFIAEANVVQKINKGRETYKILKHVLSKNKSNIVDEYIKALIYMPGYKFKKIHKFLFGCCLQKIGQDFTPDSDIIGINRTDLKDAKDRFSKKRATIKKSKRMFYITKIDDDKIEKNMSKYHVDIEIPNPEINEWLNEVQSSLLPDEIINEIRQNGTKFLQNKSNKNIELLMKTSGHKQSNIVDIANKNHINILKFLNKLLKEYKANDEETFVLYEACIEITNIVKEISKLNRNINENNKNDINNINTYILSRALCLPFNPDYTNTILKASFEVSYGFVKNLTSTIYVNVMKYLKDISMPTVEDNIIFINSIREQNKNKQLMEMNKLSMEERQLEKELKSMGIQNEVVVKQEEDYDLDLEEDYDLDFGDNDEDE